MPEPMAAYLFKKFLEGLQAVHSAGLCHRDIKCENVLFDEEYILKIMDFGFAGPISGKYLNKPGKLFSILGTCFAPELNYPSQNGYDGKKVDIFNAGVILFSMVFRATPFAQAAIHDRHYQQVIIDNSQ